MPEKEKLRHRTPELQPGRKALVHTKRVLEQRPDKDDQELTLATQCLGQFRKELIEAHRQERATTKDGDCLSRLNAIISVVMAMHFPIGNPPWDEFEKTQAWLTDIVEEMKV